MVAESKPRRRARGDDRLVRPNTRSGTTSAPVSRRSQRWRREPIRSHARALGGGPRPRITSRQVLRLAVAVRNRRPATRFLNPVAGTSIMNEDTGVRSAARRLGRKYLPPQTASIERRRHGKGFSYFENGQLIRDPQFRARILRLAIPPAWQDVRIALD